MSVLLDPMSFSVGRCSSTESEPTCKEFLPWVGVVSGFHLPVCGIAVSDSVPKVTIRLDSEVASCCEPSTMSIPMSI